MKRRFAVIALVSLGLCSGRPALHVSADEAPVFEIDDLGYIGGQFTLPNDINDAGDVAGSAQTPADDYHAFLYTDESGIRDLGTLNGTGPSQGFGINNQRHVSGFFTRADGSLGAFLYGDDIGTIDLGGLPDASVNTAMAVNDADQVTGNAFLAAGAHAFLWTAASGMQDLGTLRGPVSNAAAINGRGQIVGQSIAVDDPSFPVYHAFRYADGTGMQDLGTLPGTSRAGSSAAAINADGDVVGYSYESGVFTRAFLYTDRDGMRDLGTLGGDLSLANDINDNGAVVGIAALPSGQQHPFLHTPAAGMVDLNSLIDSTSGWTLFTAEAINNRGTIVGVATRDGRSHGYRARRVRDDSAPEIEALVSPAPNADGWNTSDVTVRWRVRDPESGIASAANCETRTLTDDTDGITLTCSATNPFGGSSSQSVTIRIIRSAPEIEAVVSPLPNAAGWNNSDVTVTWRVSDPGSSVVTSSGCSTRTLTSETPGLTLTCTAVNAGGRSTSRSVVVKIDKTPPALTCAATPSQVWPPNGDMVPVSIAVNVSETLSGAGPFMLQSISINDPAAGSNAVTGFVVGTASTSGFVQALKQGNDDGRVYKFKYTAVDAAGLTGSCTARVAVRKSMSD